MAWLDRNRVAIEAATLQIGQRPDWHGLKQAGVSRRLGCALQRGDALVEVGDVCRAGGDYGHPGFFHAVATFSADLPIT